MDGRVTIAELARRSGVSKGTVSRALNGYDDVNPATRERITQLARELGYEPDGPARALRTRRSLLVAAYLGRCGTDLSQPFFRPVLAALSTRLRAAGYGVMDVEGTADVGHIRRGGLDGAVVMSMDPDNPLIAALDAAGIPCVGVDVAIAAHVAADNRGGTALAVRHLAQLGHRRIAAIAGIQTTLAGRERLEGYRTGLAAELLPYDPALVAFGDYSAASGEDAVARLLPVGPTAIVAASDLMALAALQAIWDSGLQPGKDVAVVGFDDLEAAALAHPPLTTIRQDRQALGTLAATRVIELIEHADAPAGTTLLPVELVVRASSAR